MDVFNLVASLTLDTKEYERALYNAKATTVSTTNDIGKGVEKMKKGFLIGAGAMAAGFAAFGVSSVKTGMEFDTSMSQVAATMGKTMDEMLEDTGHVDLAWGEFSGNLREYAQEMGAHTAFSATEAADALNYMALAGYDAQKSMEMLPNVLNLAAAGSMDLATASDMVTDASSALGLGTEETTELVDKMAKTASITNTSVEQLGEAYLTVGGTAKNLKGGTTELSTALGILANSGIKGSEGGTILRNAILSLSAPTSKAKKELDELGVSVFDSEGNMRGLDEIMGDLDESMSTLTGEERAEAMSKIFNKRDLKGIEALLTGASDGWDKVSASIDNAQGSAQKMADTQLDNLQGDITLLQSAWEGFQIEVSDGVTPALRLGVQALTWMIDHANILGPIVLGLATAFTVFAVAINIGNIIAGVTKAMAALNAVLLANPIGIVVALIAGLVVAFIALWRNNEEFRDKITAIWKAVKAVFTTTFSAIKKVASTAWAAIKRSIVQPIQSAYSTVRNVINRIKSVASSAWSAIKNTASTWWNNIKTAITDPITSAKEKVSEVVDKIKGFFPVNVGKIFKGWIPKISLKTNKGKDSASTSSSVGRTNFAKAMEQPYMFKNPTEFYAGEAGDEMLYGHNSLMDDIRKAAGGAGSIIINLNYTAGDDANDMVRDIARGVRRYKMAGAF